ncbi:unnamed protein product [Peniophora sp. CBMAI 1063]|nr:unnamed protein product [Peniophora sp. CBMAI 1063]
MLATAQRLPHDVLCELFEHLAAVDPAGLQPEADRRSLGWIIATHVCARWREVGLSMSVLWADVVCTFPSVAIADELLVRARDCLLYIAVGPRARVRYFIPVSWGMKHLRRARTFRCHIDRWSTFTDNHSEAYSALTESTLPFLQHLHLFYNAKTERDDALPTLQLKCPSLLGAHFRNILPHASFAESASALSRLCLDIGHNAPSHDLSSGLSTLRDMPCLEHFELHIRAYNAGPLFSRGIVRVEKLKTLHVSCSNVLHASDMLQFLCVPHIVDTSIAIRSKLRDGDDSVFTRVLVQQPQALRTGSISVSASSLKLESSDGPDRATFSLTWWPRAPWGMNSVLTYPEILSALPRHMDLSSFTSCALWFPDPSPDGRGAGAGAALAGLRQALRSVETLTLHNA